MSVNPGDKVQFLNEEGGGTVIRVAAQKAVVEDEHGFERIVAITELVPLAGKNEWRKRLSEAEPPLKPEAGIPKPVKKVRKPQAEVEEVDLHIQHLADRYKHMTNREIVLLQMSHFRSAVSSARERKASSLIVIHGVGKGVLKAEIRQVLKDMERCSFEDANYLKYGYGATEIRFW